MKNLVLTIIVLLSGFSVYASPLTKAQNDSVMQAGHSSISSLASQFASNYSSHNISGAQTAATQIVTLMRKALTQFNYSINFLTGTTQQTAIQNLRVLEQKMNDYSTLSQNVSSNGSQMNSIASSFLNIY